MIMRSHELIIFIFLGFLSRDSSALICWFSIYLLGTSGALMCRGLPTVPFLFFLPGGCGGV